MRLIRFVIAAVLMFLSAAGGRCADPFADFKRDITAASLKPFARDIGGILGSAAYNTGRSLGFSGFDVGVRGAAQFVADPGNSVFRNSGAEAFAFPWIQAEIGMPFRLDGFIRGSNYNGVTLSGGGIRYGLRKISDVPYSVQIMLVGLGNSATHADFSAVHFGASAVVSVNMPVITPYLGAGVDRTKLTVKRAVSSPELVESETVTTEGRFTFGLHARIAQFFYITAAANMLHGRTGMEASLGTRF